MKIAIMQPYIFPYIGYYQLIQSVDTFFIFDDVAFIKKGWINKNKIVVNNLEHTFTIPLKNASQNRNINEHFVSEDFTKWRDNFYKTLYSSYNKCEYYNEVFQIVESSFKHSNIADIAASSLKLVSQYLEIKTKFDNTSNINGVNTSKSQRLIDICKKVNADSYINSIGGQALYNKKEFKDNNIELFFLQCNNNCGYISIIDLLMKNGKQTKDLLINYELI
jgi:hypothetical protein